MVSRLNRAKQQRFWGCAGYPLCNGTRNTDGEVSGAVKDDDEDEYSEARKGRGGFRSRRYE